MSYDDDACGPDCVGTTCCRSAAIAARSYCGCGGGVDHGDCPPATMDCHHCEGDGTRAVDCDWCGTCIDTIDGVCVVCSGIGNVYIECAACDGTGVLPYEEPL
jgi:hypothetical protein